MMNKRRAKIVATLGPSSSTEMVLSRLIRAGVDVIRLNFSHGSREEHGKTIARIRRLERKNRRPIAIIQDLQGPKIRIGPLKTDACLLKRNTTFRLLSEPIPGDSNAASTDYPFLYKKVQPGDAILINDGRIILRVVGIKQKEIACRVVEGGLLQTHKGVNVPGRDLGFPALTAKDQSDLAFGLARGVDYIALSMVRTEKDIFAVQRLIQKQGKRVPVIAKLEQAMAIQHLKGILAVADGVMVARGDLGVEIPLEQVPLLQKKIIKMANNARIPVITATQMLESMIEHARPTRAEVSDVANAIFDGTDAVMLSGETAAGKYPVKTVKIMSRIITTTEAQLPTIRHLVEKGLPIPEAVSRAACHLASQMDAKAIVTSTLSGGSALRLSKYRSPIPIIAFTPNPDIQRRMCLYWGVDPYGMPMLKQDEDLFQEMLKEVRSEKMAKQGDLFVMVSQSPGTRLKSGQTTPTDLIKVHQMEEV